MKNNLAVIVVSVLLALTLGFFAGTKYQQRKTLSAFGNRQFVGGQVAGRNTTARFRAGQLLGDIISKDDKSITIKLTDGSSKIILLDEKTTINKASEGTSADLVLGIKVGVFGQDNPDGSVTAQNIQLNPIQRTITPGVPSN